MEKSPDVREEIYECLDVLAVQNLEGEVALRAMHSLYFEFRFGEAPSNGTEMVCLWDQAEEIRKASGVSSERDREIFREERQRALPKRVHKL